MNTKIFVFSGTGNSLMIANEVARGLGDNDVIKISNKLMEEKLDVNAEKIGIIFPVYCYGMPNMVKEL